MCLKRKLKLEYYKNCLEVTYLENLTNNLEKNKTDIDSQILKIIKNS